ncbi:MAG: DEAD/DEAH box helicase [Alphaproteobacteria bacterium]|nr:DEAD/DEAH box helicase [Alphaproteobacteria bacterium]
MQASDFQALGVAETFFRALTKLNYQTPTPIQIKAIPPILAGRDLIGVAQTGTGKTAAFGLPLLQHLIGGERRQGRGLPRALILAPTRELALQIDESLRQLASGLPLHTTVILGGVGRRPQVERLMRGTDIVVGTPGRVLDLLQTRDLRLTAVTHFVLDEADRMLDLGFIRDIRKIISALPATRQSLMFSATMPDAVTRLADGILKQPLRVEATPDKITADRIEQSVYFVRSGDKRALLSKLLADPAMARSIVFTRTKHSASKVAEYLCSGGTEAEALHGNKSQPARMRALARFRAGQARVLVATDIAARGIDVPDISHVINFDLPNVAESYVHRIGRTARAGAAGIALSFCDSSEIEYLRDIERLTGAKLTVAGGTTAPASTSRPQQQQRQQRPAQGRRNFARRSSRAA